MLVWQAGWAGFRFLFILVWGTSHVQAQAVRVEGSWCEEELGT